MAELQQVALGLGIAFEQLQQGIAEGGAQLGRHIVAATLAADQQPLGHQLLDGFAQRRARYAELLGQGTLGGQALARLQGALENHPFELTDDIVRQTALTHLTESHCSTHPFTPLRAAFWNGACGARRGSLTSPPITHKKCASPSPLYQSRNAAN
ncbi:hypothetical protein D3C78_1403870 [compost metagenome]